MKYSVLMVDSDEHVIKDLRLGFMQEGHILYHVPSGEEAVLMLSSRSIDIVITELKLPKMSGLDLLRDIKKFSKGTKVIVYTAFPSLETSVEAFRAGASDYIKRSPDAAELLYSIKSIMEKNGNVEKISEEDRDNNEVLQNYLESKSEAMKHVMRLMPQAAKSKATIMLYGETGTGKTAMAKMLHDLSPRKDKPFIKVNSAAIPDQLLESELFGYDKGAFTGAAYTKPGRFELANGGTIFLDEIGDITSVMQVKLLRVLQEKEFEHLGGTKTVKVDVRVITATNKNLEQLVKQGLFREDLYYRLNVVPINLPPLRERKEYIEGLVRHFISNISKEYEVPKKDITEEALDKLTAYDWPGNIRELENVVERCIAVNPKRVISIDDLPNNILNFKESLSTLSNDRLERSLNLVEKEQIIEILDKYNGDKSKTAEQLGISKRTLYRKLEKYNIV